MNGDSTCSCCLFRRAFFKIPRQGNLTVIPHISTTSFEQNMLLFSIFFFLSVLVISSSLRDQLLSNQGRKNRRHLFFVPNKWREKRISSFSPTKETFLSPPPQCVIPTGNPLLCLDKKRTDLNYFWLTKHTQNCSVMYDTLLHTPVLPTGHF